MFEPFTDLFVEKIRLVWNDPVPRPSDPRSEMRQRVLDRLEGAQASDHRPRYMSAVELASLAVDGDISSRWTSIVFAQSYPDREPLSLGLQQILKSHTLPVKQFTGLSHLRGAAQLEGVAALDLLLDSGQSGGVVVAEQIPYQPLCEKRGDGALALSLRRMKGPIRVMGISRWLQPTLSAEEMWGSLKGLFPEIKLGGGLGTLEPPRRPAVEFPFQAWWELQQRLEKQELQTEDTIALLASDGVRLRTALVIKIEGPAVFETVHSISTIAYPE